ncbi:MAG: hypothetical protein Q7R89_04010, partial [bacterium]|nr:hypothetical protein [bacterium]
MTRSIFSEGKEYISASRAAEKTGYASDYIGQLCRAKKIPAQLIGRTWYVDFAFLSEHKKNRHLGKVKNSLASESKSLAEKGQTLNTDSQGLILKSETSELQPANQAGVHNKNFIISSPIVLPQPSSKTTAGEARFLNKPVFTYENDDRPRLPELSKKGRYVEPLWTSTLTKQAVALTLSLLIAISAGFLTLEHTNPILAREMHTQVTEVADYTQKIAESMLADADEYARIYANAILKFADSASTQLAAVSLVDSFDSSTMLTINNLFEGIHTGFRHLKQIALDKFFFSSTPPQLTYTAPATPPPSPRALTNPTPSINLGSLKSELKTELESYIRIQIDAIRSPIVVYSSSPTIATADFESFRTNAVVPEIHYRVTNQSSGDAERNSINLSNITDGGTFTNASISNSTFSGSLVSAGSLSFTNATGISATTTNLFSTNATFTNLSGVTLGLTDFSFTSATGTSATTTNLFSSIFSGNSLSIGGSATSTINSSGDLLVVGSTTLQNFTFINATGTSATTTNFFATTASSTNLFGTSGNLSTLTINSSASIPALSNLTSNGFVKTSGSNGTLSIDTTTYLSSYDAWTHPAYGGSATTSLLTLSGGFLNTAASSTIVGNLLITGNSTTTSATTTNFYSSSLTAGNATTTNLFSTTASSTNLFSSLLTIAGNGLIVDSSRNVGIGTTTPTWLLNPTSATASQLALSAGAGFSQWAFRNAGGNLYFATTTVAGTATSSLSALTIDSNGNVGVATTSPVAGFAVATHCVTGDTRLRRRTRRRPHSAKATRGKQGYGGQGKKSEDEYDYDEVMIKNIEEGDEIQSLDEKTGKLVWSMVNKLLYMGMKQTYKITTEDGREIRTTANHPYLTNRGWKKVSELRGGVEIAVAAYSATPGEGLMIKPSASRITSRPSSAFSSYVSSRFESALMIISGAGGWIRMTTIPAYRWGGYAIELVKSLSWVINMRHSVSAIFATVLSDAELGTRFTSPSGTRNSATSRHTFSSTRNCMFESNYRASYFGNSGCKAKCCSNVRLGEFGIRTDDVLNAFTGREHFEYEIHHDTRVFKDGLAMRDSRVGSDIRSDAFHMATIVAQRSMKKQWTENDESEKDIKWAKILSIEEVAMEDVYDIEVEGTHNFVGNDIIAHNTYLGGNLTVQGNTTLANATSTNLFSTTASSTNLFTSLFTLDGKTLTLTSNTTMGGTNTGDVTLS